MSGYAGFYAGKRVLVTGGAGFIGSNLARKLVELGARVTVADGMLPEQGGNPFNLEGIRDRIAFHSVDLSDPAAARPLARGQEVVFNAVGQVSHTDSMKDPFQDLDANCRAVASVLEACRHEAPSARVVYAATRQQYGRPRYLPLDEKHPQEPVDVNGIHKIAGEQYHFLYHRVHGLWACSLRLTNTYGPRQLMKHGRQGFVPWFVRLAIEGKELPVYGGTQRRDFTYVDDVVEAFLTAAASDAANGRAFNLGGARPYTLLEFTQALLAVVGSGSYTVIPFPEERKKIDIGDAYNSFDAIRTSLGWEPKIGLEEGLGRTVAFYREHRGRYWE